MADNVYSLQPQNEVVNGLIAPVQEPSLGQINEFPAAPPVQAMPQPAPQASPAEQQYQQAMQNYSNYQGFGQKHPIATAMLGMVAPVVPMMMGMQDQANMARMQRQIQTLGAMRTAQQEAGNNATHMGQYNHYADIMGMPHADANAVIGDKDITGLQTLLQKYGAPALMAARDKYNQDMMAYQQGQTALANYNERIKLGLVKKDAQGNVTELAPMIPEKPVFSTEGINPYLTSETVSGVTGTSNEAAKAGQETESDAATNATNLEGNKTKLAELQAEINDRKDRNQIARDQMSQNQQQFVVTSGQNQQKIDQEGEKTKTESGSKTQTYLFQDAKTARDNEHKALNTVQSLNKQLIELVGKVSKDKIRTDPRYLQLNNEYRKAQEIYNNAKMMADEKQARADRYAGSKELDAPPPPTPHATPAPARKTSTHTPTKVKLSRIDAQKLGWIK